MSTNKGKTFISDLELVRNDMREIGENAAVVAKKTGNVVEVRKANMAYRCMLQAIRDEVRHHIVVKKV
jgi:hypothetical protein